MLVNPIRIGPSFLGHLVGSPSNLSLRVPPIGSGRVARAPNGNRRQDPYQNAPPGPGCSWAGDSGCSRRTSPPGLLAAAPLAESASSPLGGAAATSSETTLSSSSHPSKRSGSLPSVAAVPASGSMRLTQIRISTSAVPQRPFGPTCRPRSPTPWSRWASGYWSQADGHHASVRSSTRPGGVHSGCTVVQAGAEGPIGSALPDDREARIGTIGAVPAGPDR
jgi:hypothetical protein